MDKRYKFYSWGSQNFEYIVKKTVISSPLLEAQKDKSDDQMKKIYDREKEICKFQHNTRKVVVKIGKMCTDTIKKEFLSVKDSKNWIPKDFWEHMKIWYKLQNWASKWNTFEKLHKKWHEDCKNIQEFMTKIQVVKSKMKELEIIIDEAITIHIFNYLDSSFAQFLGILSYEARKKSNFSN